MDAGAEGSSGAEWLHGGTSVGTLVPDSRADGWCLIHVLMMK